ncbi:MAG: SAF domain-containing protein [Acidimicrobiales bacterium]
MPLHRRLLLDPATLRSWAGAVVLAVVVAAGVGRVVARAQAAEDRWGRSRSVLVATRPVRTGDRLAGSVRLTSWPAGLVPAGWPTALTAGVRAVAPLAVGAPVTPSTFNDNGRNGESDGGRRRVAIAAGDAPLPLRRGARVDVWATTDPSLNDGELVTHRVAASAVVASAGSHVVVVAVRPGEVAAVTEASTLATISLVAIN